MKISLINLNVLFEQTLDSSAFLSLQSDKDKRKIKSTWRMQADKKTPTEMNRFRDIFQKVVDWDPMNFSQKGQNNIQ